MIKKCDRCGKPLTEFETSFHERAGSPPAINSKCWICSGAELQFMDGYTDKPHHKAEILACVVAIGLIIALMIPLVPFMSVTNPGPLLTAYSYVLIVVFLKIGMLVTRFIHRRIGKKPQIREWDPPMTRYQNHYGPNTDIYTTKINRNGDFVTTKETRLGGSIEDKWGAHASSGSGVLDKVSDFYGKFIGFFLVPCIYLFVGGAFIFWALPYVLVMLVRDKYASEKNKAVPKPLQRAYRSCRRDFPQGIISYNDKAGFLVSRENHKNKKAEETNSFLSHYKEASSDTSCPFFYTAKKDAAYMIVDYKQGQNKNYGTTFLLEFDGGQIKKRLVVGDGFLPTNPENWEKDWSEAGVSQSVMQNLDWYEQKMKKILRGMKKNSSFVG